MSYYSPEFIEQVAQANDIVDLISEQVPLKKRGNAYIACCPFHNEKTPSFNVSREKQLYHCFGCGVGGNVYTYVQEKMGLDFVESVKYLAGRAGIELPKDNYKKDTKREQELDRLRRLNKDTANFYYNELKSSPDALNYLKSRGITASAIKEFGLGYGGRDWDVLSQKSEDTEGLLKLGLVTRSQKNNKLYDRFHSRLIFPIQDVSGRVIGFGARKINENDNGPKYLNSPENELFKKGKELFNLNRAKRQGEDVLMVEGYMDVIRLYTYGFKNCVAALGTSFTSDHVGLLERYFKNVYLVFDGDSAGEKATLRALEILKNSKLKLRIVRLPDGEDPDSYIQKNGAEAFKEQLKQAVAEIDFRLSLLERAYDFNNHEELFSYISAALSLIKDLKSYEKEYYLEHIAKKTGISVEAIRQEMITPETLRPKKKNKKTEGALLQAQFYLLCFILKDPGLIDTYGLEIEDFDSLLAREIFLKFKNKDTAPVGNKQEKLLEKLRQAEPSPELLQISLDKIMEYRKKRELHQLSKELEVAENKGEVLEKIVQLQRK